MIKKVGWGILSFVLPALASAQAPATLPSTESYGTATGVKGLATIVVNWMFGILLILAVVFIVWAALLYLTSGGDEEKTKKAREMIIAAVIAIAIAILARAIVSFVGSIFGQNTSIL